MRSSRSLRLAVLLFLGVLSVATVLRAQEAAPASAGKPATPASTPGADAAPGGESSAQPAATAPDGAAPAPKGPSPSRFEPTEKVRADFDVSFPIDI
jgi:hypothetical protein